MFVTSYKPTLQKNRLFVMEPVREYLCGDGEDRIRSTADAGRFFTSCLHMEEEAEEHLVTLCLNAAGRITGILESCGGAFDAVQFAPRDILRKALMLNAVSIIVAHNHPGGTTAPSKEDLDATENLKKACQVLGVNLLDHFIISGISGDYTSLREEGCM